MVGRFSDRDSIEQGNWEVLSLGTCNDLVNFLWRGVAEFKFPMYDYIVRQCTRVLTGGAKMKLTKTESLMVEAQEKKLEGYQRKLGQAQSQQFAGYLFKKMNDARRLILHIKQNGFMRKVA